MEVSPGRARLLAILAATIAIHAFEARAHELAAEGDRLVILDASGTTGRRHVDYIVRSAPGVHLGPVGSPALLSGALEIFYADAPSTASGVLSMPSPWAASQDTLARFTNPDAPAGPSEVKNAVVRPGRSVRVVARGLGGLDIADAPGPNGVVTRLTLSNAVDGSTHETCTHFADHLGSKIVHKEVGQGFLRRLVLQHGEEIACSCADALASSGTGFVCGGACGPCAEGSACDADADCASGVCTAGVCEAPTCDDGLQNGDEVAPDCGGSCPACAGASACSSKALELIDLLNQYRASKGKAPIPASPSLCSVSDAHVVDLQVNRPDLYPCTLHSWSKKGPWTSCCYTADHVEAECMWDKPREITAYPGNGYEIAVGGFAFSPLSALESWKSSPGHNDVMLSKGVWSNLTWRAAGAGFYGNYAVMWFGEQVDPDS